MPRRRNRERNGAWAATCVILAVACVLLTVRAIREHGAASRARASARAEAEVAVRDSTARLAARLSSLETQASALRDSLARLASRVPAGLPDSEDIRALQAHGLADPVADLRADLHRHPELIPFPGVLGGTMGFYDPSGIQLLNDHWVLAGFEDGHVAGEMLLEFRVRDGRIAWRRLAARLNGP